MSNTHYEIDPRRGPDEAGKSLRLLYVSTAKYGGDWHSTLHSHSCVELFYVVGGLGQFRIGELILSVSAGDLVLVNPGVEHTEFSYNANPLEYIVLGVEGLCVSPAGEGDSRYALVNFQGSVDEVLSILRGLLSEIETKPPKYETVCQNLMEILMVRLSRRAGISMTLAPAASRTNKECAMIRRYLDVHFKESISLDQLAEMTHLSKYHMVRSFTQEYGVSPINYLISRRIRESRYLLSKTDHSLSQISHMLGFSSPSYFSQSFKKAEGQSPLEYRRAAQAEEK